jgi:hypothetical protein
MKRDLCDFHAIRTEHVWVHERLQNWARWVRPGRGGGAVHPMFRHYRPDGYAEVSASTPIDSLDGQAVERCVVALPAAQRTALQWCYCFSWIPVHKVRRHLDVTERELVDLLHDGREMLSCLI